MKHEITNEVEYLVARAQAESDIAAQKVEEARSENDYWKEKASAKIYELQKAEEVFLSLYAELKLYHPELAEAVEERKPYLLDLLAEAKQRFDAQDIWVLFLMKNQ